MATNDPVEPLGEEKSFPPPPVVAGADSGVPALGPSATGAAEGGGPTVGAGPSGPHPAAPSATRASATWTAVAFGMVFLVVVLVFILENLQDVKVTFLGASWRVPLAIDLLLAAVLGGAVVFSAGAVRLLQLRVRSRRRERSLGWGARGRRRRAHA